MNTDTKYKQFSTKTQQKVSIQKKKKNKRMPFLLQADRMKRTQKVKQNLQNQRKMKVTFEIIKLTKIEKCYPF